MIERRL